MKKILVSSNCQTGGLAAVLKYIFPGDQILPFAAPDIKDFTRVAQLHSELEDADAWITTNTYDFLVKDSTQIILTPRITFFGFHPDITYARRNPNRSKTLFHYNSKIALWAYKRGLTVNDAALLYTKNIYQSLGYFDFWDNSVDYLKKRFLHEAGMSQSDFLGFYLSVKRGGNFMHTINHPMPLALIELGRIIARKLDDSIDIVNRPISIPDTLIQTIWPIYPEIAEQLGVAGSYIWKINGISIHGVHDFLTYTFNDYKDQKINPAYLEPEPTLPDFFNEVLESYIKS